MSKAVTKALKNLFQDIGKSSSAMKRLMNPSMEGAGHRLYPPRTEKNDKKYGIRMDKGEKVSENVVRVKVQINSNAESKTLREMAKEDPYRVVSYVDVDTTQTATKENLDKILDEAIDNLSV